MLHSHLPIFLVLIAGVALIFHARTEGLHWQMGPAYLSILPLVISSAEPGLQILWCMTAAAGLLTSLLFCFLLPIFSFGPLSGPYPVGTRVYHLVDAGRVESMDPAEGPRELMIQVWYPASASRCPRAAYRRKQETTRLSSYQAVVPTRSGWNAPADGVGPLAVLVFHPAWNGRRTQNTFLTEDLASRGYFVVAVDHTYNSEPVAFPDGHVVRAHHVSAIEDVSNSTAEEVRSIGNAEVLRQAADNCFVLNTLEAWNRQKGSPWFGKLDLSACGILGHSLGGAVAVECFRFDPRVRAAMNMDGWTFGSEVEDKGTIPVCSKLSLSMANVLFFFHGEKDEGQPHASSVEAELNAWDQARIETLAGRYGSYRFHLKSANHLNFTDRPATSPIRRLAGGGLVDPRLAHRILCEATASFFSQALLGQKADWLENPAARYPEIQAHGSRAITSATRS